MHVTRTATLTTRYPVLSETFVRLEVAELRRQGLHVDVVTRSPGDTGVPDAPTGVLEELPRRRQALAAWARLVVLRPRRLLALLRVVRALEGDPGLCLPELPWWSEELTRRGTQVLHAHFAWSAASRAWGLSALTGVPWVMTVHANDMVGRPEHLQPKLQAADAVITVCEYNRRFLGTQLEHHRPVDLVVCGVEVPAALPDRSRLEGPDVVAVGRLVPKKGVDVLLRAVALLDRPLDVTVIGDGPARAQLEELAAGLGLPVRFLGALPHQEALETIARSRVFCMPFRVAPDGDRDSMPLVVKEAMARGVPVVSTDEVGVPEMVDEECGWLVPPDDPCALAAALAEALDDPVEAERRGRAGRRRVEERFVLADEVVRLRRVYERVTG